MTSTAKQEKTPRKGNLLVECGHRGSRCRGEGLEHHPAKALYHRQGDLNHDQSKVLSLLVGRWRAKMGIGHDDERGKLCRTWTDLC